MRANYALGAILSAGNTGPVSALVFMFVGDVAGVWVEDRLNMWMRFL